MLWVVRCAAAVAVVLLVLLQLDWWAYPNPAGFSRGREAPLLFAFLALLVIVNTFDTMWMSRPATRSGRIMAEAKRAHADAVGSQGSAVGRTRAIRVLLIAAAVVVVGLLEYSMF